MIATIDTILNDWSTDSKVDETRVPEELLKIPRLHSKYLRYRAENALLAKKKIIDYEKMKAVKWDYYTGNMPKEELDDRGWKPYLYSVKNKESIDRCLSKDEDLNTTLLQKATYDEAVEICTAIIKELSNRSWQLKGWIDYQRFLLGQ